MNAIQGRGKKRPKVLVNYLSRTNFLFPTKTNNQLFGIGNNHGPFIIHLVLKLCTFTTQNGFVYTAKL